MEALAQAPQPLALAELAAHAGLDQSTALRLVRALEDSQYLVRNETTRRYSPSPKLLHPLPLLHPLEQLRREAAPILKELALRLGMTTVLVIFLGMERLVLDIVQVPGSLTPYYGTWLHGPLHATGGGKSLLLGMDEKQRQTVLGPGPFAAVTPQTITDWHRLNEDLRISSGRGYVISSDEHLPGITNVAALITRWTGRPAGCLIASGPTADMDEARRAAAGDELKRVAQLLVYHTPSLEPASQFCGF